MAEPAQGNPGPSAEEISCSRPRLCKKSGNKQKSESFLSGNARVLCRLANSGNLDLRPAGFALTSAGISVRPSADNRSVFDLNSVDGRILIML